MVRECLFNILAPRLAGARVLDLFAGCGSVGLEALSRGAHTVTFVEKAKSALICLRGNIVALQVDELTVVLPIPVDLAIAQLRRQRAQFDFIFLDPPFIDLPAYHAVLGQVDALLHPQGVVVAQHDTRVKLPASHGALQCYRQRDIGDNALSFYRGEEKREKGLDDVCV
jgi:16S rRNA (guanine(966)-N(2))-methyltransferase RsmD